MRSVYCQHHRERKLLPVMIYFNNGSLGKEYICAVCSGVRTFNTGKIVSIVPECGYGFISGVKENIFFHFSNLAYDIRLHKGMAVSYEIEFLEDRKFNYQATNIRPLNGGKNGY